MRDFGRLTLITLVILESFESCEGSGAANYFMGEFSLVRLVLDLLVSVLRITCQRRREIRSQTQVDTEAKVR